MGRREVSSSLKGSKLLVWSASANLPQLILDECKNLSVPAIKFAGNPVELGRACGIPFRVSVIALKSVGDADLSGFAKSSDYYSGVASLPTKVDVKPAKEDDETKPKKEMKKKDGSKTEKTKKPKKSESEIEDKKAQKKSDSKPSSKKSDEEPKPKKIPRKNKKSEDEEEEK